MNMLYAERTKDLTAIRRSILITGAATGIGRALALRYSKAGTVLHLADIAKNELELTSAACIAAGAQVSSHIVDVSDSKMMSEWIKACGFLDLLLACAGVQYTSLMGEPESAEQTKRTMEINLMGVLNAVLPALDIMSLQPPDASGMRGQIAVLASQGAFVSVPGASAYCASKAAVDSWVVGRAALAHTQGIYMTSICPGYIRTPMTEINNFPMHGLMEPEEAADIIHRRLRRRPIRLAFPWRMYAAARFGGLLPAGFPARMLAKSYARKQMRSQKS